MVSDKPSVVGLKGTDGKWFYIADCPKCDWSIGWDAQFEWARLVEISEMHYWLYAETSRCLMSGA